VSKVCDEWEEGLQTDVDVGVSVERGWGRWVWLGVGKEEE
jgi:hypothetical protein